MRWSVGLRALLVVLRVFVASSALASEPSPEQPREAPTPDARPRIRRLLVTGHGLEARALIGDRLASDVSSAERAALLELYAIGAAWGWERHPHPADAMEKPPIDEEHPLSAREWTVALDVARADLANGRSAAAARRLVVLVRNASDLTDSARAVELRSLAFDLLRAEESPPASAPDTSSSPAVSSEPRRRAKRTHWYGWQTLIADGVSVFAAPFVPTAGAALYLTGGPIVHLANGNLAKGAASLGARVGLPLGGALGGAVLGAVACGDKGSNECTNAMGALAIIGAGAGAVSAVIVDAAMIAKEPITREPEARTSAITSLRPSAGPRKEGGFDVGLVGRW